MLIYVLVLFIIFTFILVPAFLVLLNKSYDDYYFKNVEGRKVLLNSKEKSNIKINYDYVYKNYNNTFRILKNYFIFLFILFLAFLIYNSFSYYKIINSIIENLFGIILIFTVLTIGILILINKISTTFYFVDTENNKILYRQILFGNFKKVNGKITYKYYNNKYKMIIKIKFRAGIPINIELKMTKDLIIKFTIYEIINNNFNVEFITLVNKKLTFLKGKVLMEFPKCLYGNYSNESERFLQIKKNIFNISCKLREYTNFFSIYSNNIFHGSTGIEDFFYTSIIKGNTENYFKNGNLREKREFKNKNNYIIHESFYENGNLWYKYYPETHEEKFFYITGELEKRITTNQDITIFRIYYKNGKLKEKKELKQGNGVFKTYSENGVLQESGEYKAWKKNGSFKKFYQSGKLQEIGKYEDEYIRGYIERFYENGNIKEKGEIYEFDKQFQNSDPEFKKMGKFECFYENGNIKERGVYDWYGKKGGLFEYFSKNGKLIKKENYKDGELI